jgi:hypothetical protein
MALSGLSNRLVHLNLIADDNAAVLDNITPNANTVF